MSNYSGIGLPAAVGLGGIPVRPGSEVRDCGLGEVPGAQAKLPRRLGLAVERRSSAGTAAQGLCAVMAWRSGVLGLAGRRCDVGMGKRGSQGPNIGGFRGSRRGAAG